MIRYRIYMQVVLKGERIWIPAEYPDRRKLPVVHSKDYAETLVRSCIDAWAKFVSATPDERDDAGIRRELPIGFKIE